MTFQEDYCRTRMKYATQYFAMLSEICLHILKKSDMKASIKGKRKAAGWNNNYLEDLLKFDASALQRKLIITELEKIEIAVRTQIVYILSQQYSGYWFTDATLFANPTKHAKALVKIAEEYNRSDEEFVTAFKNKYSNPFPPSWMTMEITSFGSLSILYSNLKPGKT